MSWTDPPVFVASTVLAADDLNILGDDLLYLKGVADTVAFSGVQVHRTSTQSIANATDTNISFSVEDFDLGGWWTSGTNIVVPAGAIPAGAAAIAVIAVARLRFVANATGGRSIRIQKNGSTFASAAVSGLGGGDTTDLAVTDFTTVVATDVLTLVARQNSGGSLNIDVANISIVRIGIAS